MDTYLLLNLAIECAGLVLCAVGLLQVSVTRWADRHMSRFFLLYFSSLMLLTLSNIAGQLMRGRPGPGWRAALEAWFEFVLELFLLDTPERSIFRRLVAQERAAPGEATARIVESVIRPVAALVTGICGGLLVNRLVPEDDVAAAPADSCREGKSQSLSAMSAQRTLRIF